MNLLLSILLSSQISWAANGSIFELGHTWINQQGKTVSLESLKGQPIVTTMTFTSCPGACPLMVNDIKNFDEQLSPAEKKKMRYVLFSFDPKRDTPEALRKFAEKMKLDDRWQLLTSDSNQAREMAAALGFSYKDLGDGDFTHSSSLFLLSSDGEIQSRKERKLDWNDFLKKLRGS